MKSLGVISLGCDKNRVDTENILYLLKDTFILTNELSEANVILINTCAFIESARIEAIDNILDAAQFKKTGKCEKLIVCGCLPQKYSVDLQNDLGEVDAFVGTKDYSKIAEIIESLYEKESFQVVEVKSKTPIIQEKRIISTPLHYAYLKIADGCNNHCTFCTIPSIRGEYVSRTIPSLMLEAGELCDMGVKEIILVAQDVTRYGYDIYNESKLIELIHKLSELNFTWIRLMYCYPELVTDELISEIDNNEKVAKYIDIPIQHTDNGILKLMNRKSSTDTLKSLFTKLKNTRHKIAIRSTVMVGFPSETTEQFQSLYNFLYEFQLDHVGVFAYSKEEDTPSAKLKGHVLKKEKLRRVNKIGEMSFSLAKERNQKLIGKTLRVLYEDIDYDRNMFKGRTEYDAPQIDTNVFFTAEYVEVGNFYEVEITGYDGYDLLGKVTKNITKEF